MKVQKEQDIKLTTINIDDFYIECEIIEKGSGKDISPRRAIYQLKDKNGNKGHIFMISLETDFYKQYHRETIINKTLN